MAKSFVLTNRKRLERFFQLGGKIEDLGLIVGQLSGKPKYPKGHVGSKSRIKGRQRAFRVRREELERRAKVRAASRQLEGLDKEQRKATRKQIVAAFKEAGIRFRGLGRKGRAPAVPVARVAGVVAADPTTGQYHKRAMESRRAVMDIELQLLRDTLFGKGDAARELKRIGRNSKRAIRQAFLATGHRDTGRLVRNIQYQIFTISGKAAVLKAEREARALARAAKKARKKRGPR